MAAFKQARHLLPLKYRHKFEEKEVKYLAFLGKAKSWLLLLTNYVKGFTFFFFFFWFS